MPAHAVAEGVDPVGVERQPGKGGAGQSRHAREVVDLPPISPRVERQPPPLAVRRDHGEGTARGKAAPEAEVVRAVDAAPVRRDHERDRRVSTLVVPRREHEIRPPLAPRVRPIRKREDLHPRAVRAKAACAERARDAHEQRAQRGEQDAPAPAKTGEKIWLEMRRDSHVYDRAAGSGCPLAGDRRKCRSRRVADAIDCPMEGSFPASSQVFASTAALWRQIP